MPKPLKLTEAENQYLADLMLKQKQKIRDVVAGSKLLLRAIDQSHAHKIYQKLTEAM